MAVRTDIGGLTAVHGAEGKTYLVNSQSIALIHFRHFYGIGFDRIKSPARSDGRSFAVEKLLQPMYVCDAPLIDVGEWKHDGF